MRFKVSGMFSLAVLALIASPMAQAQDPGWYLGANIGQSKAKIDDNSIRNGLLAADFTAVSLDDHNKNTGFKIYTGYQFNRYFALEGGYFNLGQVGYDAATTPLGNLNGKLKYQGLNLDALGFLPLGARFSLFGRVGLTYGQTKDSFTGTGQVDVMDPNPSQHAFNPKVGVGLQYEVSHRIALRAEVERYRLDDAIGNRGDVDLASLGLLVRFGHAAPAPVAQDPAPEPVVAVVAPPPPPAAAPAPPATRFYCSVLDIQFNIDKDDIQVEDKEKLKVVGTFMTKYPATTALIEGHSDNVGSAEHNLELSKHRAESVVTYLENNYQIDASRLTTAGYGSTRPVADNDTEEGKRQNRRIDAIISCASDVEGLAVAPARITMALMVEFDEDKTVIKPEYNLELARLADYLKANPNVNATVEGHTGNLHGTPAHNLEVSEARAQHVVDDLVNNLGVSRSRLTATAFGRDRRYAYNTSAETQQENRRVNVIFTYSK